VEGRCERHTFEAAENLCRTCGYEFCHECLVYTYGTKRAPFCVKCAISAAGVRSNAGNAPKATPREIKKELRARRKQGAPQPMASGPVDLAWAVPADDHPSAEPIEPDLKQERKRRLPRPKGKRSKEAVEAVDPFDSIPALPEELVAAADPSRALVDPSRPRHPEPVETTPPPPLPAASPSGVAPLVIDELEPAPFDHHLEIPPPAAPAASVAAPPTDVAGRPMAVPAAAPVPPAPAAPPSVPDLPPRHAEPAGPPRLVDPLADLDLVPPAAAAPATSSTSTGEAPPGALGGPQQVVGPPILQGGEAPAPFPGPRVADGLPQRTPGAQLPAGAGPGPAEPPGPDPFLQAAPAPPPVAAPPPPPPPPAPMPTQAPAAAAAPAHTAPAAAAPRPPVQDLGPDKGKGFWRLMPSSMRQKHDQQAAAPEPETPTFADLGPVAPPPPDRPLKTLAEMRPDEIDAALPNVSDLYDKVSDQNATTF
jgi:hypothetical protein